MSPRRPLSRVCSKRSLRRFLSVDILINNAGGGRGGSSVTACSAEAWDAMIEKNLRSTFLVLPCCGTAYAGATTRQNHQCGLGCGVTTADARAGPLHGRKGGYYRLTRALALELAAHGVNVNAIAPGYVTTVHWLGGLGKIQDDLVPQVPMGRLGQTEDCAKVIEFLATDLSDFVTGQVISVDGGMGHLNPYYLGPAY